VRGGRACAFEEGGLACSGGTGEGVRSHVVGGGGTFAHSMCIEGVHMLVRDCEGLLGLACVRPQVSLWKIDDESILMIKHTIESGDPSNAQEEPLPYSFYIDDVELASELGTHMRDHKGAVALRCPACYLHYQTYILSFRAPGSDPAWSLVFWRLQ